MLAPASADTGPVSGRITITAENGATLGVIPYSGRVLPVAELIPSVLLPPRPGTPDPDEARVVCRSRTPVRLILDDIPAGLAARDDGGGLTVRRIPGKALPGTYTLRLRAVADSDRAYPLTLRVTCAE